MAEDNRAGFREDPDRTDVLPVLGADVAVAGTGTGAHLAMDTPTVVAAALGVDPTQPRLKVLPSASTPQELAEARERATALAAELDEARITIQGLEDRQGRLVAELESLRQLVPERGPANTGPLRAELAQLQATVAEHELERSGWREARDAAFADVKRLSADLSAADASLATLRRELAATKGALVRTRAMLVERDAEIESLRLGAHGHAEPIEAPSVPSLIPLEGAPPGVVRLGTRTRIGRAEDNELMLDTAAVSRHHAIVIAGARGVFIEDLNSVNGLYVNRKRVRQARLTDGYVVALGGVTFRYSGPPVAAAPPSDGATRSA
jgi:hypothetical protein